MLDCDDNICKISEGAGSVEEGESEFAATAQEGGERHGTNIAASRGHIGGEDGNFKMPMMGIIVSASVLIYFFLFGLVGLGLMKILYPGSDNCRQ